LNDSNFIGNEDSKVLQKNDLLFDEIPTQRYFQRSFLLDTESIEKITSCNAFNDLIDKYKKEFKELKEDERTTKEIYDDIKLLPNDA
jgi:CHASE3 domain sensor protein